MYTKSTSSATLSESNVNNAERGQDGGMFPIRGWVDTEMRCSHEVLRTAVEHSRIKRVMVM